MSSYQMASIETIWELRTPTVMNSWCRLLWAGTIPSCLGLYPDKPGSGFSTDFQNDKSVPRNWKRSKKLEAFGGSLGSKTKVPSLAVSHFQERSKFTSWAVGKGLTNPFSGLHHYVHITWSFLMTWIMI